MIALIIATTVAPTPASADPVADKKAQAAALALRIDAEARQVELLAEQFNGAQYHLTQVQQQLADAAGRLAAAQAAAEQNRAALAREAVLAYIHGGLTTSRTMKSFSGNVDLAVQQGYFRLATGSQADALDRVRQSERALRQQQQVLQAAQRDSQAALATVSSRQQQVQAAAAASRSTLAQVQGDLVQLVAQQQAQIAAKQQAAATASLLAVQAKLAATAPAPPAPSGGAAAGPTTSAGGPPSTGSKPGPTAPPSTAAVPILSPPTTLLPRLPVPAPPPSRGAGAAVAYARAQLGKPYQWGGAGPDSFDCSGLTMRAWEAAGVSLPHYARAQYANTAHVAIADLQPGDLVFFGSDLHHMGIYVGGGQMIHAPQTGEVVKYDNIFWPDLQPFGGRPG